MLHLGLRHRFPNQPCSTFTTLHSLQEDDGDGPMGALVQGSDGNLYGTTPGGGAYYVGNVFTITPSGALTSLYSFGGAADGAPCLTTTSFEASLARPFAVT